MNNWIEIHTEPMQPTGASIITIHPQGDKKEVRAYGKINLTLGVLGLREDGYHELESVMQSIAQYDRLIVENKGGGITLSCSDVTVPLDEKNTVFRAATLFFQKTGIEKGVKVEIIKGLPHEAGLGAASGDAAAMLYYLWEEYDRPIAFEELLDLGEQVGADVPFCLVGGTALAKGKGEKLAKLPPLPYCRLEIIKPPVGASTPKIFKAYDAMTPPPKNPHTMALIKGLEEGDLMKIGAEMGNVLQSCVGLKEVEDCVAYLQEKNPLGVTMTGSGSAVVGLFASAFHGEEKSKPL